MAGLSPQPHSGVDELAEDSLPLSLLQRVGGGNGVFRGNWAAGTRRQREGVTSSLTLCASILGVIFLVSQCYLWDRRGLKARHQGRRLAHDVDSEFLDFAEALSSLCEGVELGEFLDLGASPFHLYTLGSPSSSAVAHEQPFNRTLPPEEGEPPAKAFRGSEEESAHGVSSSLPPSGLGMQAQGGPVFEGLAVYVDGAEAQPSGLDDLKLESVGHSSEEWLKKQLDFDTITASVMGGEDVADWLGDSEQPSSSDTMVQGVNDYLGSGSSNAALDTFPPFGAASASQTDQKESGGALPWQKHSGDFAAPGGLVSTAGMRQEPYSLSSSSSKYDGAQYAGGQPLVAMSEQSPHIPAPGQIAFTDPTAQPFQPPVTTQVNQLLHQPIQFGGGVGAPQEWQTASQFQALAAPHPSSSVSGLQPPSSTLVEEARWHYETPMRTLPLPSSEKAESSLQGVGEPQALTEQRLENTLSQLPADASQAKTQDQQTVSFEQLRKEGFISLDAPLLVTPAAQKLQELLRRGPSVGGTPLLTGQGDDLPQPPWPYPGELSSGLPMHPGLDQSPFSPLLRGGLDYVRESARLVEVRGMAFRWLVQAHEQMLLFRKAEHAGNAVMFSFCTLTPQLRNKAKSALPFTVYCLQPDNAFTLGLYGDPLGSWTGLRRNGLAAAEHLFYRLPTASPLKTSLDYDPTAVAHGKRLPLVQMLLPIRSLLSRRHLNKVDTLRLLYEGERLVTFTKSYMTGDLKSKRSCDLVVPVASRFLVADALCCLCIVLGEEAMQKDLWWTPVISEMFALLESWVPSTRPSFHDTLLKAVLQAGEVYKTGGRPPAETVVNIKRGIFCHMFSHPYFKKPAWRPWREDDAFCSLL
ncbi:hypothetical protein Efla_004191 [Eimeria flavescens]